MARNEPIELIARGLWRDGERILICRNRRHGHAFLPGGHVEFGEPAARALQRECREEMGLDVTVGALLGVCEASFLQKRSGGRTPRRHHEINLVFDVHRPPGRQSRSVRPPGPPISRERKIEFEWINAEDLRGPKPAVRLLPPGIVPVVLGALDGAAATLITDWSAR